MRFERHERKMRRIIEEAEHLLDRWAFVFAEDGSLRIRPEGPTLEARELAGFLRLLADVFKDAPPRRVVFDLGQVQYIGPRWTEVLALFIDFAERLPGRCRITSVHDQPAAAAGLYRQSRVLSELFAAVDDAGDPLAKQIA